MTMQARPVEGAIRFTTPNPWDDPLFRSAIQGIERAQRREDMQRAIDGAANKEKQVGRLPAAAPRPAPTGDDEPWVCPDCGYVAKSKTTVGAHKRACAALYERRKDAAPRCPARSHEEGFACGAIPEPGSLFCPKHEPKNQPPKPMPDKEKRPADVQLDTKAEPKATQTDTPPRAPEATEERAVTATEAPPKAEKPKAAPKKPAKPDRRPCGCGPTGRHQVSCKLAPKPAPGKYVCTCGKDCLTASGLGGHRSWCERQSKGAKAAAAALEATPAAPALTSGGTVSIRLPDLRAVVVRLPGGVQVELPSVQDAAAFVRLVGAT